jgi:hypothetical protein
MGTIATYTPNYLCGNVTLFLVRFLQFYPKSLNNPLNMKNFSMMCFIAIAIALVASSCSHGISIEQAANGGKAKCGRNHLK